MKKYTIAIIIGAILLSMTLPQGTAGANFHEEFEFSIDIHEYSLDYEHEGQTYNYYQMSWEEIDGVVFSSSCFYNCYTGRLYSIGGIVLPDTSHISGSKEQLQDQRFNIYNEWKPEVIGELLYKSHEREVDEVAELKSMVQILLDRINKL